MEDLIKIHEEINKFSDSELLQEFSKERPKYGKMHYYPVFANRITEFEQLLRDEIVKAENSEQAVMGNIKVAWIPVVAIFDHAKSNQLKKEIGELIKLNWSEIDYTNFLDYIKNEKRYAKYIEES